MKPTIEGFEIVSLLGSGAMSTVWKARHLTDGRIVALKVLHPHAALSPSAVERFLHEVRAYERLRHPNVISCVGGGRDGDQWFVALELLEAGDLRTLLRTAAHLPPETAAFVLSQLLEGLKHAHSCGLCHRDVKPENVMLSREGVPKLADFGIATGVDFARLTEVGKIVGTPAYMAPEQVRDGASDERSDLWSCGVLLYEMVCGVNPFAADTSEGTLERLRSLYPAPAAYRAPAVPADLDDLLLGLLVRDIDRRVPSADDALEAIAPIVSRSPRWACAEAVAWLLAKPREALGAWAEEHASTRLDAARALLRMSEPRHAAAFIEASEALAVAPTSLEAEALVTALGPRVGARLPPRPRGRISELEREAESSGANVQALVKLVRAARANGDVWLATRAYRWGRTRSGGDRFAFSQLASALGFELAGHIERRRPEALRSALQSSGVLERRPEGDSRDARTGTGWWMGAAAMGAMLAVALWGTAPDPVAPRARGEMREGLPAERLNRTATVFLDKALHALDQGDAARARSILRAFLERWPREPRRAEALFQLGRALEAMQLDREAIDSYSELLASHPQSSRAVAARRGLARVQAAIGQLDVAILELAPLRDSGDLDERASVRLQLAGYYATLGRDGEARELYELVLAADAPSYLRADALLGLGRVQLRENDPAAWKNLTEAARVAGPGTPIARAVDALRERGSSAPP